MNPRIDVNATLKMWPAPPRAEPSWEERAHAIVRAALAENKNPQLLDALLSAPPLLPEPGELSAVFADGAAEPRSKRASLREMAERHSSRVLLLKKQEEAAAKAHSAIQGAQPAAMPARAPAIPAAGPSTAASAPALRAEIVQLPAKRRGSSGIVAGVAIAAMGIAAAFAITQIDRLTPPAMAPAPAPVEAPRDQPAALPLPEQAPPREASAQAEPPAENPAAPPAPIAASKAPQLNVAAPLPTASAAPELAQGPSTAPTAEAKPGPAGTQSPDKPHEIKGENPLRIGDTPAESIPPDSTIPQQPAQGSIAPALRSVMGGAKKCVAGANDVSHAAITFGSDGAVKSVAVTGWAAANGATGCITTALKGANVKPFWKPSFTVSVAIKP